MTENLNPFGSLSPEALDEIAAHGGGEGKVGGRKPWALGPARNAEGTYDTCPHVPAESGMFETRFRWRWAENCRVLMPDHTNVMYEVKPEKSGISQRNGQPYTIPKSHSFCLRLEVIGPSWGDGSESPNVDRKCMTFLEWPVDMTGPDCDLAQAEIAAGFSRRVNGWTAQANTVNSILAGLAKQGGTLVENAGQVDLGESWKAMLPEGFQSFFVLEFASFFRKRTTNEWDYNVTVAGVA